MFTSRGVKQNQKQKPAATTLPAYRRHDLTDPQWEALETCLPAPSHLGRPRKHPIRDLVDGIFYRTRTGCP
ncbi:hypothetical protein C1Y63_02035, partial [Corynebacterium sp. 13CS0277]